MSGFDDTMARAEAFLASLPGAADKAVAASLNKAAKAAREEGVKAIADRYAAAAGDVRERTTTVDASSSSLSAAVKSVSPSLQLGYFPHSPIQIGTGGPGRPQLRAEVLRGQERDVPGAFVAPIGGKPRIMIRTGGITSSGKSAIKPVFGPPIAVMLGVEQVREKVERIAIETFDAQIDKQIDAALKKAG